MQNRFKEIICRYLLNTADSKEKNAVDDFVNKLQKKPFISLSEVQNDIALKNAVFARIKFRTKSRKKRRSYSLVFTFIALLLVSLSIYTFQEHNSISSNYYVTSNNEAKTIDLLDGSTVRLSANSSLTISNDFNGSQRKVLLKGEAFFNVAKNVSKPFIITSKNFETSVLGTSFLVNDEIVSVSTGRVKVSDLKDKEHFVYLTKDERLWFFNDRFYKNSKDIMNRVSSNATNLLMDNITLAEWKFLIELEFGIEILFEDQTVNHNLLIKADFRNSTLRDIIQSIGFVYGLDFKYENNKLIINNNKK